MMSKLHKFHPLTSDSYLITDIIDSVQQMSHLHALYFLQKWSAISGQIFLAHDLQFISWQ